MSELGTNILIGVITTVVSIVATFVCKWLQSLYENNKSKIKNEKVATVLGQVTDMITAAVETTTSTYVKELKNSDSFTAEAQKEAFQKTHDAVVAQLTTDAVEIITETYGDLEAFLTTKIEQTVEQVKK